MNNDIPRAPSATDDCSVRDSDRSDPSYPEPPAYGNSERPSPKYGSIDAIMRFRATRQGRRTGIRFLHYDSASTFSEETLTYSELLQEASAVAGSLQQSCVQGSRALILCPPGTDYITAFFACQLAGVAAVPAYPPRNTRHLDRLKAIIDDCSAAVILASSSIVEKLKDLSFPVTECGIVDVSLARKALTKFSSPPISPDMLAFLQYTSGTTGLPKGVMISHAAAIENVEKIIELSGCGEEDSGVLWLPPFHDMGLVAGLLVPLAAGFPITLMSPASFLQRPARWLEAMSAFRATITSAPNFAWRLCVDETSLDAAPALDLGSMRSAFSGAERVDWKTLRDFGAKFGPSGFRMSAFLPVYGMAETVLMATGKARVDGPLVRWIEPARNASRREIIDAQTTDADQAIPVVSCGTIISGHELRIVDPDSRREAPDRVVGEIWINGPCVSKGYWGKPEETEQTFRAQLADDERETYYLRTGDLGFVCNSEVYVLGRIKEMVIVRGRNFYAQDIEGAASSSDPRMGHNRTIAFGVERDAGEALILVHELTRSDLRNNSMHELGERIREAVLDSYEVDVDEVAFVKPASLPRTSSGKLQRGKTRSLYINGGLAEVERWRPAARLNGACAGGMPLSGTPAGRTHEAVKSWLRSEIALALNVNVDKVQTDQGFAQLGLDSLGAIRLVSRLSESLGVEIDASELYDTPTIDELALLLSGERAGSAKRAANQKTQVNEPIAIVGMACRFPGEARNLSGYWALMSQGRDAISLADGRVGFEELNSHLPDETVDTIRRGGFVSDIDKFDAAFFQIAPVEAVRMDPQQRMVLEVAWSALEHAGLDPKGLRGHPVGVFIGISLSDYSHLISAQGLEEANLYSGSGNAPSVAAGRLSYVLGLEGPAVAVDTACSSSLVAVHQACSALQRGEAEMALAGAVNAILRPDVSIAFARARMLSPDGRCKTFDASADGYVRGEGCGVVVLKRLSDAERDGDPILAVIRGSAVNQDGASAGLTVPSGPAQQRVIAEALDRAGLSPDEVDYLEAHGTGTAIGDPIEMRAAAAAYGLDRPADRPLLIGSVKTNIGHLESASGIAGLIKTVLTLQHGLVPKHLNFSQPSPHIDWAHLPVRVASETTELPKDLKRPWRAGVSAFAFSGTNAHVIVESYERRAGSGLSNSGPRRQIAPSPLNELLDSATGNETSAPRPVRVLPLSGKTAGALRDLAGGLRDWLAAQRVGIGDNSPAMRETLSDAAFTAGVGRSHFAHRAAIVFQELEELDSHLAALAKADDGALASNGIAGTATGQSPSTGPVRIGFLYTGQGSQWIGMGRGLYETEPEFRAVLDRCDAVLSELRGASLLDVMFGRAGACGSLDDTSWTQPALYALEAGLTVLWANLGVRPSVVMGHSVGELAAAFAAGVYSLEDGLRFAAARGSLMGGLPTTGENAGAMLAVFAPAERIAAALAAYPDLSLAADNGAHRVVSGPAAAVEALQAALASEGLRAERLRTSHAFHSKLMDPILDKLEAALEGVAVSAPGTTLISNVTGGAVDPSERLDGPYWRRHARAPVAFATSVRALSEAGVDCVIEIGPHGVLSPMAALCWPNRDVPRMAVNLSRGRQDPEVFAQAAAAAYAAGAQLDFAGLYAGEERARIALPSYPFQRERYWIETRKRPRGPEEHHLLGVRRDTPRGETIFERELSTSDPAWLADHVVFERVVAPGAFYGVLAAAAAGEMGLEGAGLSVDDVQLHMPLLLDAETGRALTLVVSRAEEGVHRFEVFSRGNKDEGYVLHAEGCLGTGSARGAGADLAGLGARLGPLDHHALYDRFSSLGIDYGPAFRGVASISAGDGEALATVRLAEGVEARGLPIHPAHLDSVFQTVAAAALDSSTVFLPFGWERLTLVGPAPELLVVHARLRGESGETAQTAIVDFTLYDEDGRWIGAIDGLILKKANRKALLAAGERVDDVVYGVVWRGVGVPELEAVAGGPFLLAGAIDGPTAARVRMTLEGRGISVLTGAGDPARMLSDITATLSERDASLAGVLFIAPDPASCALRLETVVPTALTELLELSQAIVGARLSLSAGLSVITHAGVLAQAGEAVDPEAASLWGFARSLMTEEPGLLVRLLDLAPNTLIETDETGLAAALLRATEETQLALRANILLAPRLERERGRLAAPTGGGRLFVKTRGSFDGLSIEPVDTQPPGPGEITLAVRAAGLNFRDLLNVLGAYPGDPGALGGEVAGTVVAVGEGVRHLSVGERAFGLVTGGFSSALTAPATMLRRLPDSLDFAGGATIPVTFATALAAFDLAGLKAGERVLIHAGAGGVGLAAIALAKARGAEVIATASAGKRSLLHRLGVTEVFDSRSTSFASDILNSAGGAVDVVLNSLTGEGFIAATLSCLAPHGRFVEIAKRDIWTTEQMAAGRPDVAYSILALDDWMANDPERVGALLDRLIPQFADGTLTPLPRRIYSLCEAVEAMQFMASGRHVGKIVLDPGTRAAALDASGSALITGGLGALGLSAAEFLARAGMRHLVLAGRRGPNAEAARRIAQIGEETGATIVVAKADVAQREQVDALVARFSRKDQQAGAEWPPLCGVIHAAGVLDDGVLAALDTERFARVFAPKAAAAAHLDAATRDLDLAFFVLYSSLAGTLGSPGQANYAAANAYLDGLAAARRASGLAATSIAWGPWAESGMAASETAAANLRRQGLSPLAPERAHQALLKLLANGRATSVIVDADWRRMGELMGASRPMLLSKLIAPIAERAGGSTAFIEQLKGTQSDERESSIVAFLQGELQAVLGLANAPDPKAGFFDLGMDSLMAVELRNRLERAFKGEVVFSNTVAFDFPDAMSLSGYIARSLETSLGKSRSPVSVQSRGEAASGNPDLELLTKDLERAKALRPPQAGATPCPHKPRHIFLTGGNGFLGRYLLRDLLQNSDAQITCLVRAQDEDSGRKRLFDALLAIDGDRLSKDASQRIHVALGDLTQLGLGLSPELAETIALSCDTILHCAAAVNHGKPYSHLHEPNVLSLFPLLDMMARGAPKALHFVSSILVFDAINGRGCFEGEGFPEKPPTFSGYAMSKWGAEQVLMRARGLGFTVNIYRPSLIIGDTQSGYYDIAEDDFGVSYLKLALATGLLPRTELMAVVNVDETSRSIVTTVLSGDAFNRNFNIFGIDPLETKIVRDAASTVGVMLEEVDIDAWYAAARALAETRPDLRTSLMTAEFIEHKLKATDGNLARASDAPPRSPLDQDAALEKQCLSKPRDSSAHLMKTLSWLAERRPAEALHGLSSHETERVGASISAHQ